MRRAGMFTAIASCLMLALEATYAYEALQGPTELRYWDQTRAYDGAQMDAVVEVDMAGNVVWEWWFFDHVVQDIDPAEPNYVGAGRTVAGNPHGLNLNLPGRPVRRDWLHCNSLDYNAELDQVVIDSVQGEFHVIDHGNTFIAGDPDGSFDAIGRGGLELAPYFEWGGRNDDHTWAFDTRRSGWPAPIQDVLVANGVDVVFHGHDHLFAKQELDHDEDGKTDLIYLACPRPSYRGCDTVHPEEGGYVSGDFLGNSGHLRVTVSPAEATIEYVRAYAPEDETEERVNGQASYSFSLTAGRLPSVALIPAGEFEMGDHHDLGGLEHGNDEVPLHVVSIDAFQIGTTEITNDQYCEYLNSAFSQGLIEVRGGLVYAVDESDLYCETRVAVPYSRIGWDGSAFAVLDGREYHPMVGVRWHGAAAYCNWLSAQHGYESCYDLSTWECDFSQNGFRLPTEAEWEYAARGGRYYYIFPWGNDENQDGTLANWPSSGDPYEVDAYPHTTPVGFYNGQLHRKADFGWPGSQDTYQTSNGTNSYGLHDMSGNAWEWCNDWYSRTYYSESPRDNPRGPDQGDPMPDGQPYRVLRSGNWYNGHDQWGHGRTANRNPAYYRGPDDPDHAWYHVGFRVARTAAQTPSSPTIAGTTHSPTRPAASDPVWVTTTVTDDGEVQGVTLTYDTGAAKAAGLETVFQETMRTEPVKPWTGDGCDNQWAVTASLSNHAEQRTQANYGEGNPCGLEFGTGTNDENETMVETANGFDARGASGYVEFWNWADGLEGTDGWTFQLDSGSGYTTRLSELNGSNHGWQQYRYDLAEAELVNGLKMRFQFRGGDQGDRVRFDYIVVKVSTDGGGDDPVTVSMYDDGAHQDGSANDNVYGAQIPAFPEGTTVRYYITATDDDGRQSVDPAGAPGVTHSYTVQESQTERTIGLFLNDPRAAEGYTLFAPKHFTATYLINNEGRLVHSWESGYEPGQSVYLLENGHLLRACFLKGALTSGGEGGRIEEYDWDGNLVWEFGYSTEEYMSHHDIQPLPNGNVLVLAVEKRSYAECIAAGFDPSLFHPDVAREGYLLPDYVIEVEPTRPAGGNIVWEWHVWDHLIQDYDPTKDNYGDVAAHPELIDANGSGRNIRPFWNHMNSIHYSEELDQIVLSVRGNSEIWVIDHSTTTAQAAGHTGGRGGQGGDLLYRWGNPQTYQRGEPRDQMLFQQHDAQWIADGCPGAGNILIFNNGLSRNYSSVDEIAPPVDASGHYFIAPDAAFGPEALTWTYQAGNPTDLYSEAISGAQRLPNGNTLICDGVHGVFLEVTADGETVWKYVNPVVRTGPLEQGEVPGLDDRGHQWNAVFKIHRYDPDYPGLAGRDLTPGDPIEFNPIDPDPLSIVTDMDTVTVPEGDTATFQVKLSAQPSAAVTVTVGRAGGDADVTVQSGASLTFTPANWATYQAVTLSAAEDSDTVNGSATMQCLAAGCEDKDVTAGETDDDVLLTVTSAGHGVTVPSGTVTVDTNDAMPYPISATPEPGYGFSHWTESIAGIVANTTAASTTVTAAAHATVTAHFTPEPEPEPEIDVENGEPDDVHSHNFGVVELGGRATQAFFVRNEGQMELRVSQAAGLALPFTIDPVNGSGSDDDWVITPGGAKAFTAVFAPISIGGYSDALILSSNDTDEADYEIQLTGAAEHVVTRPLPGTIVLGRPTGRSVTVNTLVDEALEVYFEYGTESGTYTHLTAPATAPAGEPAETVIDGLLPDARYYYRARHREAGDSEFAAGEEHSFHTQSARGGSFTFTIQADSHLGTLKHCDPDLYRLTVLNALADEPDFHLDLGDTFRATKLKDPSYDSVAGLYVNQRPFFGLLCHSAPLFLAIGNHEGELGWWLDGTPDNIPVWAATARKLYYPNPAPDAFYTGSTTEEAFVGLRESYYAWQWGDALFVVIEPWWYTTSSPQQSRDNWDWTIGYEQYAWLKQTLEQSETRFKFVFSHHALGTCRGGIEWADLYEWGGHNRKGVWEFDEKRPGWDLPIHPLMAENGVTVFFQGHDHLFAKQERDGVVYQTCPMPGDPTYTAYNEDAFHSAVTVPNSGHVRVTVARSSVTVDYIRAYLAGDGVNGELAYSYTVGSGGVEPVIDELDPRSCAPGDEARILGSGFGASPGDSIVHLAGREFDAASSWVTRWSDSEIGLSVPYTKRKCKWWKGRDFKRRKLWVTVDGMDSNTKMLRVLKPDTCP